MREPEIIDVTLDPYGRRTHQSVSRFLHQNGIPGKVPHLDVSRACDMLVDGLDPELAACFCGSAGTANPTTPSTRWPR